MNPFSISKIWTLALILLFTDAYAVNSPQVEVKPPPSWVEDITFTYNQNAASDNNQEGLYYLLIDEQTNVLKGHDRFRHYAFKVTNEDEVADNSSVNIAFAPEYQSLTFHAVRIWRNGNQIDQLNRANIKLLQREKRLEELVYDGRWTATLILEDVRKGDVVEYSYSINGSNPAFNNEVSHLSYLQWEVPIQKQVDRVLWPDNKPIHITKSHFVDEIKQIDHGGYKEYRITTHDKPLLHVDSESPKWFDPWPRVQYSSVTRWEDVVKWGLPHYANRDIGPGVRKVVSQIRDRYQSRKEQAAAAIQFVQDEVRYLGIEIGVGSFIPSPADETLKRRYGDCKDKTSLLLTMLGLLDIEAYPVLANTTFGESLNEDGPKLSAFNHVLASVYLDGKQYWVDPTINNQKGSIDTIYQPDYGQALMLKEGNRDLVSMHNGTPKSRSQYHDVYDLRAGINKKAIFTVSTTLSGKAAEVFRREMNAKGRSILFKGYMDFYAKYYPGIEAAGEAQVNEDSDEDLINIVEKYQLNDIWTDDKEAGQYTADFFTYAIRPLVDMPEVRKRNAPLELSYPLDVAQTIEVLLPEHWDIDDDTVQVTNPFIEYTSEDKYISEEHKLLLTYHFRVLQKVVPPSEIETYIQAIKKIKESLNYSVYSRYTGAVSEDNSENATLLVIVSVIIVLLLYASIEIQLDKKKAPTSEGIPYYPVSSFKFFSLSILTLNVYTLFWFYKSWSYVKQRDRSTIMPWARALFYPLWYFPLYSSVNKECGDDQSQDTQKQGKVFLLLAIGFFLFNILVSLETALSYMFLVLTTACALPLVEKLNHLSSQDTDRYHFNSRWRPRHAVFILLGGLLVSYDLATSINYLPNDRVVAGDDLWGREIQYMLRLKLLEPDDRLNLFYSSGTFSFKEDGNGLSDRGVFSYWEEGDPKVVKAEYASFDDIKDVQYTTNTNGDSTIKILRKDGSDFLLFITTTRGGDKEFNRLLKKKWQEHRSDQGS